MNSPKTLLTWKMNMLTQGNVLCYPFCIVLNAIAEHCIDKALNSKLREGPSRKDYYQHLVREFAPKYIHLLWNISVMEYVYTSMFFCNFYPPTERFGAYSDEPGVRPSVSFLSAL